MKVKTVPALEARTQFGQIMKEVQGGQAGVLVEKSGVPMVGIISAQEFQPLAPEAQRQFSPPGRATPDLAHDVGKGDPSSRIEFVQPLMDPGLLLV